MNIAIQGIKGSFHHIAALEYFGEDIHLKECMSFTQVPRLVKTGLADYALMAVEEPNIGAIQTNYTLIDKNNMNISGEIYLSMQHSMIALKGQKFEDIKEVVSHPIIFSQCSDFLHDFPNIKLIEATDTASIAKRIQEEKLTGIAAIGSEIMSKLYDLDVIVKDIHNDIENMLRFFVLQRDRKHTEDDYLNNKASLKILVEHKIGSLANVLNIFAKHQISIDKIESLPVKNNISNKAFFIDVTFDDYHKYCQCLIELEKNVGLIKILGEYKENIPKEKEVI